MKTRKESIFFIFCFFFAALNSRIYTAVLSNQYMIIEVDESTGAFTAGTSGGSPDNLNDDNKRLLYRQTEFTSYASVFFNNQTAVYGSDNGKTMSWDQPPQTEGHLLASRWKAANFLISQVFSIVPNPNTGREDMIRLQYIIEIPENTAKLGKKVNAEKKQTRIGLRILFDTFLGANDGSPFILPGTGALQFETMLSNQQIPRYWYTYDNLKNPTIRATGILKPLKEKPPNKIVFANYDNFRDCDWLYIPEPETRGFSRTSMANIFRSDAAKKADTAAAIFWENVSIEPGKPAELSTYLGLYESWVASGESVTISLSIPREVTTNFTVTADVENTLDAFEIKNCSVEITCAGGADPDTREKTKKQIGIIASKKGSQTAWNFSPLYTNITNTVSFQVLFSGTVSTPLSNYPVTASMQGSTVFIPPAMAENDIKIVENTEAGEMTITLPNIEFAYKSASILPRHLDTLARVVDLLGELFQKNPEARIEIGGHSDNTGSELYNIELSAKRASAVLEYLMLGSNLPMDKFSVKGYGPAKPLISNDTEEGRRQNRRVEFFIRLEK